MLSLNDRQTLLEADEAVAVVMALLAKLAERYKEQLVSTGLEERQLLIARAKMEGAYGIVRDFSKTLENSRTRKNMSAL